MLDAQAILLMHPHEGHSAPMTEVSRHEPADQDEEREWFRGGRIFRCTECNERVVIGSQTTRGDDGGR